MCVLEPSNPFPDVSSVDFFLVGVVAEVVEQSLIVRSGILAESLELSP